MIEALIDRPGFVGIVDAKGRKHLVAASAIGTPQATGPSTTYLKIRGYKDLFVNGPIDEVRAAVKRARELRKANPPSTSWSSPSMTEPYHAADAISSGDIKRAHFKSLYDYKYRVRRGDVTAAMRIGTHAHRGLLQPDYAESQLVIYDGATRRGRKWEEFVAANPHVPRDEIVNPREHAQIVGCIEGVKRIPDAYARVTGGTAEMELFWDDEITGLRCKAKPDMFRQPALVDLKTVSSRHFSRDRLPDHATAAGWNVQLAWYCMGLRAHGYTVSQAHIVVVESQPPHDCVVWQVARHLMANGLGICRKTLDAIAEAEKSGVWPGIGSEGPLVLGDPWAGSGPSSKTNTEES